MLAVAVPFPFVGAPGEGETLLDAPHGSTEPLEGSAASDKPFHLPPALHRHRSRDSVSGKVPPEAPPRVRVLQDLVSNEQWLGRTIHANTTAEVFASNSSFGNQVQAYASA